MIDRFAGPGPFFSEVNNGNDYIVLLTADGANRIIYPTLGPKPNLGDLVNFHAHYQLTNSGELLLDTKEELNRCGSEILNANPRLFDANNELSRAALSVPIKIPDLDALDQPSVCLHGIPGMESVQAQATVAAAPTEMAIQKQIQTNQRLEGALMFAGCMITAVGLLGAAVAIHKGLHAAQRGYNIPVAEPPIPVSEPHVFKNLDERADAYQHQVAMHGKDNVRLDSKGNLIVNIKGQEEIMGQLPTSKYSVAEKVQQLPVYPDEILAKPFMDTALEVARRDYPYAHIYVLGGKVMVDFGNNTPQQQIAFIRSDSRTRQARKGAIVKVNQQDKS